VFVVVDSYPGGSGTCNAQQTSISPMAGASGVPITFRTGSANLYSLTPQTTTYTPGSALSFTLSNTATAQSFEGFLFYTSASTDPTSTTRIGTWTSSVTGHMMTSSDVPGSCGGASFTHSDASTKTTPATFTWTPSVGTTGTINVYVAIMEGSPRICSIFSSTITQSAAAGFSSSSTGGSGSLSGSSSSTGSGTPTKNQAYSKYSAMQLYTTSLLVIVGGVLTLLTVAGN